jgi:hypothetical protein
MSIDTMFFECKVDWQAAKNIKASAHPRDEKVFAIQKLIEDWQIQIHKRNSSMPAYLFR